MQAIDDRQQIRDAVAAFQARWHFVAVAVYRIEGDYCIRVAAEGAACCECDQVPLTAGNIGLVARTGQPHISRNVDSDPSYRSCFAGVKAEAVMPVRSTDQTIGIVDVEAGDGAGLDVAAITAFAADIAALLANAT